MATTQPLVTAQHAKSVTKKADIALTRGVIVVEGAAVDSVKLPSGADEGLIVGVVKDDISSGEYGEIYISGIVPTVAGAAITVGLPVSINGNAGKAKPAAPGSGANSFLLGFARSAASGDGIWFQLEIAKSVMQGA